MKQDDVLKRPITELSDDDLMDAFDRCLAKDEVALMWFLAGEIKRRRLEIKVTRTRVVTGDESRGVWHSTGASSVRSPAFDAPVISIMIVAYGGNAEAL